MTLEQVAVGASLIWLVFELIRGKFAPAAVFVATAFAFLLFDFISLRQTLQQLTNTGLITVVVLMLLSVVLNKAQLVEVMIERLVRGPYRFALAKLYVVTASTSAFVNNTAVVAALLGPVRMNRQHAASRLLLPMCYAASLGGVLTLVGTSTNLLVSGLLEGQNMTPLRLFDLFPVGVLIVIACGAVMVVTLPWLLEESPATYDQSSDYFLEASVSADSVLVGKSVEQGGLRRLAHLFLSEIVRGGRVIAPVQPDEVVQADDLLVFTGDITRLDVLTRFAGLHTHGQHYRLPMDNLVEVVISAGSTLARQTIRESNFRSQFDAAVIAVRRGKDKLLGPIANIPLQVGDTLVLVVGKDFEKRNNLTRNFVVVSRHQVQKFVDPLKGVVALIGFIGAIVLSAVGLVDFLKALLILLALFLLLGFTKIAELRRSIPYDLIAIIASALVISEVMISSGVAELIAHALLLGAENMGPHWALTTIIILTWLLTELMSNNAAAALSFPVAVGVAQQLGLSPMPFVMAVLYGASCSFLTPYGYQTNLMVMSPGRYALRDFVRCGFPVAIVFLAVTIVAVPVFFPFK